MSEQHISGFAQYAEALEQVERLSGTAEAKKRAERLVQEIKRENGLRFHELLGTLEGMGISGAPRVADTVQPTNLRDLSLLAARLHGLRGSGGRLVSPPDSACCRWYEKGFPTFELTTSVTAKIALTEIRGLLAKDLRLPFEVFAIQLPSPSPIVLPGDREVRCLLCYRFDEVFGFDLYDGSLRTIIQEVKPDPDEVLDNWASGLRFGSIFKFVVGICEYIHSLHSLPPPEGKRKPGAHRQRPGDPPPPLRWVLGRAVKLSHPQEMIAAARAVLSGELNPKERAQYRLTLRFVVRGHFKQQVCGKGRVERRKIWIEPYWKGPNEGDGLTRHYDVGEDEP